MKKYRFGLDVGTNSLGWSVLELDEHGSPHAICAAGSRIFSEGRVNKTKATLTSTRREKRSARRRRDRFKQRQRFLLNELTRIGLFPQSSAERRKLQSLNPLALRATALKQRLEPWEVGRALFHLNQRRGFKSNRKDRSEEATGGVVSRSARLLLQQMGLIEPEMTPEDYRKLSAAEKKRVRQKEAQARKDAIAKLKHRKTLSYGAFLYGRQRKGMPTRARKGASGNSQLYDVYPTRELYEDEFSKIWQAQSAHHSKLMTEYARERVHRAIFHQRPLKPQERGKCAYLPAEDRTFRAMPSFQRYRIYQEVNNLEWWDGRKNHRLRDYPDARDHIVSFLERVKTKTGLLTFGNMKKVLRKFGYAEGDFTFNFESPKRRGLDGNLTTKLMQHEDCVGIEWHDWPLDKQDELIGILLNGTPQQQQRDRQRLEGGSDLPPPDGAKDDEEVREHLVAHFGLAGYYADNCLNAALKEDTANVSRRAAQLMLDVMRDGLVDTKTGEVRLPLQSEAASAVARQVPEFIDPFRTKGDDGKYPLLEKLPYYGEVFQDGRHIIPGTGNEDHDDRTRWGGVTNPTVHIAFNQIRLVVNELIDRYGHPYSVAIELGRELPVGADQRRNIEKEQSENQKRNERFDEMLQDYGKEPNVDNRLRLFLWEQLSEDPAGRCCPFTGKKIGIADLFDSSTEVEHLIPFSVSLDDSRANKVICTREANRKKGNRTPYEAFGDSPSGYNWDEIVARAEQLPHSKRWRFKPNALEIWQQDEDSEFTSRHLNDTRYIGRLTREYLESICQPDKIDVVTGRLTGLLRRHWGLNSVFQQKQEGTARKNRDDHRHHAVDAIVVGMTSRNLLQRVAAKARELEDIEQAGDINLNRLFPQEQGRRSAIDPWEGFRDDAKKVVRGIVVSHKARRKIQGQLHNDTAYGIVKEPNGEGGLYRVVSRKPVSEIKSLQHIEAIRDRRLRHEFKTVFESAGSNAGAGAKTVQELASAKGIRRVRLTESQRVIPIEDAAGRPYKAYKGDSNWGIEIYAFPKGHKKYGRWDGVVISRFAANQKGFRAGQTFRPHPGARLVMRLQINDCVEMDQGRGDSTRKLYRLQKMDKNGRMDFAEAHEANVDRRNRSKDDPFKYTYASGNTLKARKARKVHVSPAGRTSYERRRAPRRRSV